MKSELKERLLSSNANNIILECATGTGKTKLALEKSTQWGLSKVLIVVPRLVLIDGWKKEIKKWKISINPTFVTYASIHKIDPLWDIVIFDEAHHISNRVYEIIKLWSIKRTIFLSATISFGLKERLKIAFKGMDIIKVSTKDAIEDDILPTPEIFLIPLKLNNTVANQYIYKNKATDKSPIIPYTEKWKYKSVKAPYRIKCTEQQWYDDISGLVEWYKRKAFGGNQIIKNLWLQTAGKRLKQLAVLKTNYINYLLSSLQEQRVLVFCSDIQQSKSVNAADINSKVGIKNLELFNDEKINHISAVGMLDEGCNLTNCRIGIFNMLNASDRLTIQRIGRILRHPKPIIIIPFYKNTREEEIVNKLKDEYGEELINTITNINNLKL